MNVPMEVRYQQPSLSLRKHLGGKCRKCYRSKIRNHDLIRKGHHLIEG